MTSEVFQSMHGDLFDVFGEDATVQRGADAPVPVRVVIDRNVQRFGANGEVAGVVSVANFMLSQWSPKPGDVLSLTDSAWTKKVDVVDANDGYVAQAVMHG